MNRCTIYVGRLVYLTYVNECNVMIKVWKLGFVERVVDIWIFIAPNLASNGPYNPHSHNGLGFRFELDKWD